MEKEEIFLVGAYKDFRSEVLWDVHGATPQDIAAILVRLSDEIEPYAYRFSGIDTALIDAQVNVEEGLPAVCDFLKKIRRDSLLPAARGKSTMMPIAESYLLNRVLTQARVAFKPVLSTGLLPGKESPADQIVFIGNCKGWFAAKKMTVDPKTEDWEASGILAGINYTIVNKSFEFAGLKEGETAGGRKSLGNLIAALALVDASNAYAVCKTCENFGYPPYATPTMLTDEYPGIKPPKVKGRKPKT